MLTMHHLEHSRSQRILWLLEEMGVPYEVKRYTRDPETMLAPPELVSIHALGKSPVITDGDITVAESGAIIEYLVEECGGESLRPARGTPEGRRYTYWLHYAEGTFAPFMILSLIMSKIETAPMPFFIKPVAKGIVAKVRNGYLSRNVERNLDFINDALSAHEWFAGDAFSAADIQMSFALEAASGRTDLSSYPKLVAFLDKIQARPAYQRAIEVGGPYQLMGAFDKKK